MNDLHRLLEDATPEPVRGLSVDAVVTAARRRRRLRAGAAGLALALVLGGVGTAFAVTRQGPTQSLQPADVPAPAPATSTDPDPAAAPAFTVDIAAGEPDADCAVTQLVARPTDGPSTPERALRALLAEWDSALVPVDPPGGPAVTETADLLISVRLADGIAYVNLHDFTKAFPWAGTSCGGVYFFSSFATTLMPFGLNAAPGPFDDVVRMAIEGDPRPAAEFFQADCEDPVQPGDPCDPSQFAPTAPSASAGPPAPVADVQIALLGPSGSSCVETTLVTRTVAEQGMRARAVPVLTGTPAVGEEFCPP